MARKVYVDVVIKGQIILELEEGVELQVALQDLDIDVIDNIENGDVLNVNLFIDSHEITN